ncbi:MAG: hypothetical protein H6Q10_1370, partial [Acidobacteria bacterium]|nr:hypothetical protein [Acidobacteriota bacterium]
MINPEPFLTCVEQGRAGSRVLPRGSPRSASREQRLSRV